MKGNIKKEPNGQWNLCENLLSVSKRKRLAPFFVFKEKTSRVEKVRRIIRIYKVANRSDLYEKALGWTGQIIYIGAFIIRIGEIFPQFTDLNIYYYYRFFFTLIFLALVIITLACRVKKNTFFVLQVKTGTTLSTAS